MTSIHIKTNGSSITAKADGKLTSGMVGISVTIEYDEPWNGLTKTAVFKVGDFVRDRKNIETETTVPWEVMRRHGGQLLVGLEGRDQDGNIVMPTIFAPVGTIYQGALSGIPGSPNPDFGEDKQSHAVLFVPQKLSEQQKVQAKENIGASTFYHTKREKVMDTPNDTDWAEYIYSLYEELGFQRQPVKVKDENGAVIFTNYEFVISTGEYSTAGNFAKRNWADPDIKKPKYLILSGIHGNERNAALSVYRFIRDVVNGHNVPQSFKEGAIIHVMPVGNPYGFNNFKRQNANNVDINRNFNAETKEKETQAIISWLSANSDADLFIDMHNGSALNEIVAVIGDSKHASVKTAKKIALKGVDRIIPFWRYVKNYPDKVEVIKSYSDKNAPTYTNVELWKKDVIYSYCSKYGDNSLVCFYASNVLSIPGLGLELADYHGDYSEYNSTYDGDAKTVTIPQPAETYPALDSTGRIEAIAAGAEAIGNILLEMYEQSVVAFPDNGVPIYNGEAILNINTKTHAKFTGEVK